MAQEMNSLLQGLSQSLNQYLGMNIQNKMEQAKEERANQAKLGQMNYQAELDLAGKTGFEAYKLLQEGKLDLETAKQKYPQHYQRAVKFEQEQGRPMTLEESKIMFDDLDRQTAASDQKELNRKQRIDAIILGQADKLTNNKIIMESKKAGLAVDQVDELLRLAEEGNTVAFQAAAARTARAMGEVGVLTDADLERYVRSKQVTQGFADKMKTFLAGSPTNMTIGEIKQAAQMMKTAYSSRVGKEQDRYVNVVYENLKDYGFSKEEIAKRLDVEYSGNVKGQKKEEKPKIVSNKPASQMTDAEIKAALGM